MKKYTSLLSVALLLILLLLPMSTHAYDVYNGVTCSGSAAQSTVCNSKTTTNPLTGTDGTLAHATNIVAYAAGGLAVVMLIYGGIKYITAYSDTGKLKSARDTIIYALIGLVVIVVGRELIYFVLSKL